jgi:hypothetical protein
VLRYDAADSTHFLSISAGLEYNVLSWSSRSVFPSTPAVAAAAILAILDEAKESLCRKFIVPAEVNNGVLLVAAVSPDRDLHTSYRCKRCQLVCRTYNDLYVFTLRIRCRIAYSQRIDYGRLYENQHRNNKSAHSCILLLMKSSKVHNAHFSRAAQGIVEYVLKRAVSRLTSTKILDQLGLKQKVFPLQSSRRSHSFLASGVQLVSSARTYLVSELDCVYDWCTTQYTSYALQCNTH